MTGTPAVSAPARMHALSPDLVCAGAADVIAF